MRSACFGTPARGEVARVAQAAPGPQPRKSASSERMTSACSKRYCASTYSPNASFAPARALSRLAGSHWCHFADGKRASRSLNLRGERRRADRLGEDAEPGALERLLRRERRADRAEERRPRTDLAEVGQRLRAIGIVEAENRRLREDVAWRRGCRDAAGCPRSSSAALRGSRRAGRWRRRRAASPSRRTAACRGRAPRADGRTGRSSPAAAACRR